MSIDQAFVNGVFERRHGLGLSLGLKFAANAEPRLAMVMLQNAAAHGLRVDRQDEVVVTLIRDSGDWDGAPNRNIRVHLSAAAVVNPLAPIAHFLESITLDTDHDLQKLQTGRQKKREEAYAEIVETWITPHMRGHVRSWGMTIEHMLVEQPGGFYGVDITISYEGEVVATYRLDGWSGLLSLNGGWIRDRRPTPAIFNERVEGDIIDYLDRATSTVLTA